MSHLGIGATGASVSELQAKLNKLGYGPVEVNGAFDEATRAALMNFQSRAGLAATGALGNDSTESILNQALLAQSGQLVQAGGGGGASGASPSSSCPTPLWKTGLMWAGGLALLYGAWQVLQGDKADADEPSYRRALEPGREAKDITPYSQRLSGGCPRTPGEDNFLKAPRVEA